LFAAQLSSGKFNVQLSAFSSGHFEVGDRAIAVLVVDDFQLFARGDQGVSAEPRCAALSRPTIKAAIAKRMSRGTSCEFGTRE